MKTKKLCALHLSLLLLSGSLSLGESSGLRPEDILRFGRYEQDNTFSNGVEDIEWYVLSVEDNKALLISR